VGVGQHYRSILALGTALLLAGSGLFLLYELHPVGTLGGRPPAPEGNHTLPDLAIDAGDISFSNDSPMEGEIVVVLAQVRNVGGEVAENVSVEFDDWCQMCGETYVMGVDDIGSVPPGGAANASVSWDTTGRPGWNWITVIADPSDRVEESTEGNNAATKAILVEPAGGALPDLTLAPSDIAFSDDAPIEGDAIAISARVYNVGLATAENVTVEFRDDVCPGCNSTYVIGTDGIGSIPPGGNAVASVSWDTTGQPGVSTISVIADPADLVAESNESNNEASRSIVVQPVGSRQPLVDVLAPNGERWTGGSGHSIMWFSWDDLDDSLFIRVSLRLDWALPWTNVTEGTYPVGTRSYPWTVPFANTTSAIVRVCATDGMGLTSCDDGGLAIDSMRPAIGFAYPADGALGVPVSTTFKVYFSEFMDEPSAESAFSIVPSVAGLAFAWDANLAVLTISHDPLEPNTTYAWGFSCGPRDRSDPGNPLNSCPITYTFATAGAGQRGADLTLTPEDIWSEPPEPVYGKPVTLHARIRNVGDVDAHDFFVGFADNAICMLDVEYYIGDVFVPLLPAGGTTEVSISWDTTKSADGYDLIGVGSDGTGRVVESDELNNGASRHIYVRDTPCERGFRDPDLAVSPSDIYVSDESPNATQSVTVLATVRNVGNLDAYNVTVRLLAVLEGNSTLVGEAVLPLVPPGGARDVLFIWTPAEGGLHTLEVVVDPRDEIREPNEADNRADRSLDVGPEAPYGIFVQVHVFDDDRDGRYDDALIMLYDMYGRAVEGASVTIDGVDLGHTSREGLLLAYDFPLGTHVVFVIYGLYSASATFVSDG